MVLVRMSKDELRCDSLQFSPHNLQISLSLCSGVFLKLGALMPFSNKVLDNIGRFRVRKSKMA